MDTALPHLLVADDDAMNRRLMSLMLRGLATAEFAEDGDAALALLSRGGFDGALLDVRMPGRDGLSCARDWRSEEIAHGGARLPLVACTANVLPVEQRRALDAGFDRILHKPVFLDALRDAVRWIASASPREAPAPPLARRA